MALPSGKILIDIIKLGLHLKLNNKIGLKYHPSPPTNTTPTATTTHYKKCFSGKLKFDKCTSLRIKSPNSFQAEHF